MKKRMDTVYYIMALRGFAIGTIFTLYVTDTFFTFLEFFLLIILVGTITVPIVKKQYEGIDDTTIL